MGELFIGQPVAQIEHRVSQPFDLVSYLSMLHRAIPGSGLDPSLIATRRSMPSDLQSDLDVVHGFSGRWLYYVDQLIVTFDPLVHNEQATIPEFLSFLRAQDPSEFRSIALEAVARAHADADSTAIAPTSTSYPEWREYLLPVLTTARPEDAFDLLFHPADLKQRTIELLEWAADANAEYFAEESHHSDILERARAFASTNASSGFGLAFSELTGNRLPATIVSKMAEINRVVFCPSHFVDEFVSFVLYPPYLIIYYDAEEYLTRSGEVAIQNGHSRSSDDECEDLSTTELLDSFKALSDTNRWQIVELLNDGELYAQEIVKHLKIAQSAVSRHLSVLERAGLVTIQPRGGMKYYSINREKLDAVAANLRGRCSC